MVTVNILDDSILFSGFQEPFTKLKHIVALLYLSLAGDILTEIKSVFQNEDFSFSVEFIQEREKQDLLCSFFIEYKDVTVRLPEYILKSMAPIMCNEINNAINNATVLSN